MHWTENALTRNKLKWNSPSSILRRHRKNKHDEYAELRSSWTYQDDQLIRNCVYIALGADKDDKARYVFLLAPLDIGRAGVPIEVMGMMLGEFVDDLTIYVKDVFPMPQLGTEASVETIDEKYQSDYLELMKQTGRFALSLASLSYSVEWKTWSAGITPIPVLAAGSPPLM